MASFLWRNDDLRRLRTRNLVLQGADGVYPAADALLRFVDAEGTVGASGIFVDDSGNLVVTGSADISGGLSVGGSVDISGDMVVSGDADICGNLTVGSMTIDTLVLDSLSVTGSVDISGGLTVGSSMDISGGLTVDGSGSFGGDLSVDGSGSFGGDLFVGGSVDISGDLYVYGLVSASGDVISHSGLSRLSTNAPGVGICAIYSEDSNTLGPQINAFKKRGDTGAVQNRDELCRINFFGLDTSGDYTLASAAIRSFAADNFTSSSHAADIRLATRSAGKTEADDRLIVSSNGGVSLLHNSATSTDNYFERYFNDPCGGHVMYTRDYIVGQNDTDFGGNGPYRDYRYVYGPFGNSPVWGIVNDASGGSPGNVEFYQNISVGAGSKIDPNSAITIGGARGRSIHRVFQGASYNALVTEVASGTGNVGYKLDAQYYNGIGITSGANLLLNSDTGVITPGNVGIGTSAPATKLHLYTSGTGQQNVLRLESVVNSYGGSNDGPGIEFYTQFSGNNVHYFQASIQGIDDDIGGVGSGAGGLRFNTFDKAVISEKLRISSNGNVGIGTSAPAEKLDISGNCKISGTLHTYTNRNIHGNSDKGYSVFTQTVGPIGTPSSSPVPNPVDLSSGLWVVTSVPQGAGNENAQPSGVFYWDGLKWTGNAVSYNFTLNVPNSAIGPIAGGGQLQVANNGGGAITVDVFFRQLLSTP